MTGWTPSSASSLSVYLIDEEGKLSSLGAVAA